MNGKAEYATYVNSVIEESRSLVTGDKTIHDLDKDTFPIVIYLAEHDADFLRGVETTSINHNDYVHVRKVLNEDKVFA